MNRLRDMLLFVIVLLQGLWAYSWYSRTYVGERAEVTSEIGKPYAVLTIDYGEPVKGFREGEFYVLKVLKIRATKIDYGFCPIQRTGFYQKESQNR